MPTQDTYEIVTWSYVEGTEEPETYTILKNGKDTGLVDENREALQQWIDSQCAR